MRRFTLGSSADRKVVVLEIAGPVLSVTQVARDGTKKRRDQTLATESAARTAADKLAKELLTHGYVEHSAVKASKAGPATAAAGATPPPPPPAAPKLEPDGISASIFDDLEVVEESAAPLARLAHPPAESLGSAPSPKKKKKKKRGKKQAGNPDGLDKRVLAGIGAVVLAVIAGLGFVVYDSFLKPPSILGAWGGSMVEHEISQSLTHTSYRLVLDENKRASMAISDGDPLTGTYSVKGNRLSLALKDEEGLETNREYVFKLGRGTLDLIDPESGKLLVQMIHIRNTPTIAIAAPGQGPESKNLVDANAAAFDPDVDKTLAAVEFSAKDAAFKLRHPQGWTAETGARPDNTYSYVILTKSSAKIQAYADIQGSLMSGSDSAGEFEEGSEFAPVHKAHELYKRVAAEELSDYVEGRPDVFKGSGLGEGRLSVFTASGGLFGGKLKGYHVTLLTRDRRVSILAYGPEAEFETLRPTYLAVCRSVGR